MPLHTWGDWVVMILPDDRELPVELSLQRLTRRQLDVLIGLSQGLTGKQIASRLNIHRRSVSLHISGLKSNLDANTTAECVQKAARLGILKPGGLIDVTIWLDALASQAFPFFFDDADIQLLEQRLRVDQFLPGFQFGRFPAAGRAIRVIAQGGMCTQIVIDGVNELFAEERLVLPKKPCSRSLVKGRKGASRIFNELMAFNAV